MARAIATPAEHDQPLLRVENLSAGYRVYKGFLQVLDDISLSVHRGEKIGLVGESGCGKTTTMKAILQMLPANGRIGAGNVWFDGTQVLDSTGGGRGTSSGSAMERIRGKNITAIFQNPGAALNPVFTIGQQMHAVVDTHWPKLPKDERRRKVLDALRAVRLPDADRLLSNYPSQLSGGMKQRVCIALALLSDADLIIADEPGTALDATIEDQIMRLFMELIEERNSATIFITHSLGVVRQWMDRVYVMYAGSIVEAAPTETLFSNPLHPYTRALLQAVPKLTGGGIPRGIDGRVPEYDRPPVGCRFHPRCAHKMDACLKRPPLVDVGGGHLVACHLY